MTRVGQTDLFEYRGDHDFPPHYSLVWTDNNDQHGEWGHRCIDPYSFDNQISDYDLYLIRQGKHLKIYQLLGANPKPSRALRGSFLACGRPTPNASVWWVTLITGRACVIRCAVVATPASGNYLSPSWKLSIVINLKFVINTAATSAKKLMSMATV